MERFVCLHGHFYQPPRENPWLEDVELEDSAYPYHDWNRRITAECYAPNTASRILDSEKRIIDIVNNYTRMSFNFGPTLLSWLEKHKPELYHSIIEVDESSREKFSGHGSAIAQAYNHMIMPLANRRDKVTQVLWGIRDFEHRFGRKPEGMWLPETAVDMETLDIIAERGIGFTILAPHQARRVRKLEDETWSDVTGGKIDPKKPYLCRLPTGREINLFFYDGPISRDVSFGDVLKSGEGFAARLVGTFAKEDEGSQLVHIATDGETYGHHHRFGDMSLAYCHYYMESNNLVRITNYAEYLEKHPPEYEVEILDNTSWSCAHGVDRWRNDCGCNTGIHPDWNQKWRIHLRGAMDWLRDNLIPIYEEEAASYLTDPWAARDGYIEVVLDRSPANVERFLSAHARGDLTREEKSKVLKLLEIQHHAMLMYTSCGWFFDDVSGIESIQVMSYAFRAIQLAGEVRDADLEPGFTGILKKAKSNKPEHENGARIAETLVKPAVLDLLRVGAHYAISSLFKDYTETQVIYCYMVRNDEYDLTEAGRQRLAIGRIHVRSDITWEENDISFAVLHLGDHNIVGGVRDFDGQEEFSAMRQEMKTEFEKGDLPDIVRLIDKHFGSHNYSIWHLFGDEQREVLNEVVDSSLQDIKSYCRQVSEINYPVMNVMRELKIPLPAAFSSAMEFVLVSDLEDSLEEEDDRFDLDRFKHLVSEVNKWSFELKNTRPGLLASKKINRLMENLHQAKEDVSLLETISAFLATVVELKLDLNLWKAQNVYFSIGKELLQTLTERAGSGDKPAEAWVKNFNELGRYLDVRIV